MIPLVKTLWIIFSVFMAYSNLSAEEVHEYVAPFGTGGCSGDPQDRLRQIIGKAIVQRLKALDSSKNWQAKKWLPASAMGTRERPMTFEIYKRSAISSVDLEQEQSITKEMDPKKAAHDFSTAMPGMTNEAELAEGLKTFLDRNKNNFLVEIKGKRDSFILGTYEEYDRYDQVYEGGKAPFNCVFFYTVPTIDNLNSQVWQFRNL